MAKGGGGASVGIQLDVNKTFDQIASLIKSTASTVEASKSFGAVATPRGSVGKRVKAEYVEQKWVWAHRDVTEDIYEIFCLGKKKAADDIKATSIVSYTLSKYEKLPQLLIEDFLARATVDVHSMFPYKVSLNVKTLAKFNLNDEIPTGKFLFAWVLEDPVVNKRLNKEVVFDIKGKSCSAKGPK
jgi:hypothetical protein